MRWGRWRGFPFSGPLWRLRDRHRQSAVYQHQSQNQPQYRRAAEYAERGPAHDGGQEGKGGARKYLHQNLEGVGHIGVGHAEQGQEIVIEQGAFQTQKKTGGH